MPGNFIPFALPDIGQEEIDEVVDSLKNGWLTTGPKTKKFEEDFKAFLGCRHALAVNSGTSGLHLALEAIGLRPGDKVIVPVNTFTATAEVVRYFDADPVFCDIDAETFTIDILKLQEILEHHPERENIKGIIPVHLAGQVCEMGPILKLARERGIFIIEDAAHAFPAKWNGNDVGILGDITVFSFYPTKTLATAEGGMVVTNVDRFAERIKLMRQHGIDRDGWDRHFSSKPSWHYSVRAAGYKYNMNDLSASIGIHQLAKAERFLARRQEIAEIYRQELSNVEGLTLPSIRSKDDVHAYHLFIVKVEERDDFIDRMKEYGIGTSVHFIPLHLHPYWKDLYKHQDEDFPVALATFKQVVSLPIYTRLTNPEVSRIVTAIKKIMHER